MTNTKLLMTASSIILGVLGLSITFLPQEFLEILELSQGEELIILVQLLGAVYFGFAMLNWSSRDNLIGGIYSRPIAIGNFAHFFIGGLALIKAAVIGKELGFISIAAIIYFVFAIMFGILLFNHPQKKKISFKE